MIKVTGLTVPDQVFWSDEPVLLTSQIAEFYECSTNLISKNFSNHKDKFIEGKHYFKLEGAELQNWRLNVVHLPISPFTRTLYLWTKRGCARHAKILNNEKSWLVFEALEDNYFSPQKKILKDNPAPAVALAANFSANDKVMLLMEMAKITPDESQKTELIRQAAFILNQN